jgi:hypothetical protein
MKKKKKKKKKIKYWIGHYLFSCHFVTVFFEQPPHPGGKLTTLKHLTSPGWLQVFVWWWCMYSTSLCFIVVGKFCIWSKMCKIFRHKYILIATSSIFNFYLLNLICVGIWSTINVNIWVFVWWWCMYSTSLCR